MKKTRQQSRSGWGGKRKGAGAPFGNTNAVKHGERSRRAFFPVEGEDALSPLVRNRTRNLILAERYGQLLLTHPEPESEAWREMTLIHGLMGLHADRIARLELSNALTALMRAKRELRRVKTRRI
ncbi:MULTISPECIES: hypothetical protein [Enterobacteriaceae]|jgi:hypothetical protein|uniref:hypothetical protein n=1 Tax=Enterobacteriaceae TaxID=543 RepID=UPI0015EA85A5|nr:hypothetical protein [Enterobacter roggenkampii]QLR99638.1 hypothetical protein HV328_00455 [Enterobacter roggenkampii]